MDLKLIAKSTVLATLGTAFIMALGIGYTIILEFYTQVGIAIFILAVISIIVIQARGYYKHKKGKENECSRNINVS